MTATLIAGLLAGYGIAMPVGAMSVLIVTLASRASPGRAMAAAMGVATADGIYAFTAVAGGTALSRVIAPAARYLEIAGAVVLTVIAVRGLWSAACCYGREVTVSRADLRPRSARRTYLALVGLTLLNPVTIVYFAALVVGHQADATSFASGLLFVLAAFAASASWQLTLASGGALLRRVLTSPRGRLGTALAGNTVILLLAVRLAWSAR